jgi:Ca-activated chloride channel homolog
MNIKSIPRLLSWTAAGFGAVVVSSCTVWAAAILSAVIISSCAVSPEPDVSFERPGAGADAARAEEVIVTASRVESDRSAVSAEAPAMMPMIVTQDAYSNGRARQAPLASVGPGEELWIIATPSSTADANADDSPGTGAMLARFKDDVDEQTGEIRKVPLPLKHTDVRASINGYISTVNVRQQFQNPFDEKIEAVYMFPLPQKAAVSGFLMIIGERRIRGILRRKEEAEAIYNEARSQGYQASLLVQHRPNIFEQKVANIEPGKAIDVDIKYFHTLSYDDGWYSFVFPTVVGPRYNPSGHQDAIVPVPRGSVTPASQAAVHYLRPEERSAHDLSIAVEIDAGVEIEELKSSHAIVASRETADSAKVELAGRTTIPNKDFVLKFRVAGDTIKSNLLAYEDPETLQGYFTLMLYPPAGLDALERRPMEMVFVLDCSGSMDGRPLEQAKAAVATALDHLQAGDTFQIIRFSDDSSQFGAAPVPATRTNLELARVYLKHLDGSGGTQMIEGMKAALDFPHDPARLRFVSFLTDGYIGNEADIIAAVHDRIGSSRIFSFGVGSAVNRYLLERMAKEGRGAVAYLGPQDSATEIMNGFFDRISHPVLTDVRIDWGSMAVTDVYPAKLPDLFVGRPVVVTGKYLGAPGNVTISGRTGAADHRFVIATEGAQAVNRYIPRIWARLRIAELADRQAWDVDSGRELAGAIRRTALEYQLMSAYTSFVAVDTSHLTEGLYGTTVHQAIPVPEGVRYDTTVRPDGQER